MLTRNDEPYQHGEVYVLDDGSETDLDLGHYERFTHSPLSRDSNWTAVKYIRALLTKNVAVITWEDCSSNTAYYQ